VGVTAVLRPVVAGIDGSPAALSVATAAARQARRALRPLRLVQASPGGTSRSPATGGRGWRGSADQLEAVCAAARSEAPAIPLRVVLREGPADVVLLDESRTAALLVLGSGVTAAHRELGPVAAAVVRAAVCPALLERPIPTGARGVVVGVDCGPGTVALLAAAMTEACLRSTSLLVVHAWGRRADGDRHAPYEGAVAVSERRLVEQHVLPFRQTHPGVPVTVRAVRGEAQRVLLAASCTAELVVVGRCDIGRGVPHDTIGPVATRSAAPVLVVPVGAAVPEPDRQRARRTAVALSH